MCLVILIKGFTIQMGVLWCWFTTPRTMLYLDLEAF